MNRKLFAFAFVALLMAGCTQRLITAESWLVGVKEGTTWRMAKDDEKVLYTAYLETSCFGSWCTTADSRVKACTVNMDNTLSCKNLADAEKVLNP